MREKYSKLQKVYFDCIKVFFVRGILLLPFLALVPLILQRGTSVTHVKTVDPQPQFLGSHFAARKGFSKIYGLHKSLNGTSLIYFISFMAKVQ
jgi:hypothetical protein